MALMIETFVNAGGSAPAGGRTIIKALGHPLAAERAGALLGRLARARRLALYDPFGYAETAAALYDFSALAVCETYVQRLEDLGRSSFGLQPQPVDEIGDSRADMLLIASFDAAKLRRRIDWLIPRGVEVVDFDALRRRKIRSRTGHNGHGDDCLRQPT